MVRWLARAFPYLSAPLALIGCTALTYGLLLGLHSGDVLSVQDPSGANLLGVARQDDPTINEYLKEHGLPEYVAVRSDALEFFYLEIDTLVRFPRANLGRPSEVVIEIGAQAHLEELRAERLRAEPRRSAGYGDVAQPRIPGSIETTGSEETSSAAGSPRVQGGVFREAYVAPYSRAFVPLYRQLANGRVLTNLVAGLNASVVLPTDVTIALEECGAANASYDPNRQRISICYELLARLSYQFENTRDPSTLLSGTFVFIVLHELGHALVHILQLPITGLEEDAVDQFATIALLEWGHEGEQAVVAAASWFALNSNSTQVTRLQFADEHSLDAQRFYNILCWIYGADPHRNVSLVQLGYLPQERALQCPHEHQQMKSSWERLLAPHER